MTLREVQLSTRAASELRLDRYDEAVAAAWFGARWYHMGKKMPDLKDALAKRRRAARPRSLEADVMRWQIFFASVSGGKGN